MLARLGSVLYWAGCLSDFGRNNLYGAHSSRLDGPRISRSRRRRHLADRTGVQVRPSRQIKRLDFGQG
jgi:hypothetical protein